MRSSVFEPSPTHPVRCTTRLLTEPLLFALALLQEPHAVTEKQALFRIPDVTGKAVRVADCDADGLDDLVVQRVDAQGVAQRIDLVSTRDGTLVSVLWRRYHSEPFPTSWDAGGDRDGDGTPDLVVGLPWSASNAGRVIVVSGCTSARLFELEGDVSNARLGTNVAFVGDVDCDGRSDFVVGTPEAALEDDAADRNFMAIVSSTTRRWHDHDPTNDDVLPFLQRRLDERASGAGRVTLHSGMGGREMWRRTGAVRGGGFGAEARALDDLDADGCRELWVRGDALSREAAHILSGSDGTSRPMPFEFRRGIRAGGDVDGDGTPEILGSGDGPLWRRLDGTPLFSLPNLDWCPSSTEIAKAISDLDGDGCDEVVVGEPNFGLPAHHPNVPPGTKVPDIGAMTIAEALGIESDPWHMGPEAGAAVVYSGRTREAIFGVWGVGSGFVGVGAEVLTLPDVDGDGAADVLVGGSRNAYVFRGPGRRAR